MVISYDERGRPFGVHSVISTESEKKHSSGGAEYQNLSS